MFNKLSQIFSILDKRQKIFFFKVQFLVCIQTVLEVFTVLSLIPFMKLLSDKSFVFSNLYFFKIYEFLNFKNLNEFVIFISLTILLFFLLSSIFSIFTLKKISYLGVSLGMNMSKKLFSFYINKDWQYHTRNSSSAILNKISHECGRITSSIMIPFVLTIAKIFLILFMYIALLFVNINFTLIATFVFSTCYFFIFKLSEKKLEKNGKQLSLMQEDRFKVTNESLGGIKQIILSNLQSYYENVFNISSEKYSKSFTSIQVISVAPKYILEFIAVFAVVILILYFYFIDNKTSVELLPILSVYGLAGYKILPAFQSIYFLIASIKGNFSAYENIKEDYEESLRSDLQNQSDIQNKNYMTNINFKKNIELQNVSFQYETSRNRLLKSINIQIKHNTKVGIVGRSGSGKSTFVDLILGLLNPTTGKILIDDIPLIRENIKNWQKNISYVPQDVFLLNGNIRQNILFNNMDKKNTFSENKLIQACKQAEIFEYIKSLPKGFDTLVGERGIQLSGGQRQRIAIARAIFQNKSVLVLDEATSSLDKITEKKIIKNINTIGSKKTLIIITHRLSTVADCDVIFFLHDGKIHDSGKYSELIVKNKLFSEIAGDENN